MRKCQLLNFCFTRIAEWVCTISTNNKYTKEVSLGTQLTVKPRAKKPSRLLNYRLAVKNLLLSGTKVDSEEFKTSNIVLD